MTIHPKDLRRLIVRVIAVTVALRALHLFSVDFGATEVAAAWALPVDGHTTPALHLLLTSWRQLSGGFVAMVRAPTLFADVALPLIAVAYARASGWGTLAGLLTGLMLAVAPFGLDEGWRADGSSWLSMVAFASLWQLRKGLRRSDLRAVGVSSGLLGFGLILSPMMLLMLPAGLYAALRSVTLPRTRQLAVAGWSVAAAAGMALGHQLTGGWFPGLDQASGWLLDPSLNPESPGFSQPVVAAWQTLVSLSPGGTIGSMATLAETPSAPLWRGLVGGLLWPLAILGFARGLVREDLPTAATAAVEPVSTLAASTLTGAGAADGWRSLGVSQSTAPRRLGERDAIPLLLPAVGAAAWAAWASMHHNAAGIMDALAIARPFIALFLGLGVTAFALMPTQHEELAPASRAVPILVLAALLQFGLGAHHTYVGIQELSRKAPTKIARFVASNVNDGGEVLAIGLTGLQVAWRLGPWPDLPRVHRSAARLPAPADAAPNNPLTPLLAKKPNRIALVGDRWALEPTIFHSQHIDSQLKQAGYALLEDGHRLLGAASIRIYARTDTNKPAAPSVVRPQLFPGQAP